MIEYLRKTFPEFFKVTIVLTLIGILIASVLVSKESGLVIGSVVCSCGLMMVISGGGLIATFLNMDEKLQSIDKNIRCLVAATNNNPTDNRGGAKTDTGTTKKEVDRGSEAHSGDAQ